MSNLQSEPASVTGTSSTLMSIPQELRDHIYHHVRSPSSDPDKRSSRALSQTNKCKRGAYAGQALYGDISYLDAQSLTEGQRSHVKTLRARGDDVDADGSQQRLMELAGHYPNLQTVFLHDQFHKDHVTGEVRPTLIDVKRGVVRMEASDGDDGEGNAPFNLRDIIVDSEEDVEDFGTGAISHHSPGDLSSAVTVVTNRFLHSETLPETIISSEAMRGLPVFHEITFDPSADAVSGNNETSSRASQLNLLRQQVARQNELEASDPEHEGSHLKYLQRLCLSTGDPEGMAHELSSYSFNDVRLAMTGPSNDQHIDPQQLSADFWTTLSGIDGVDSFLVKTGPEPGDYADLTSRLRDKLTERERRWPA